MVVTGASDGIGKEFARQFAQKGFNIFLISRTESKLQDISEQLSKDYKVEVKYLTKDFTKSFEKDFFDDILSETKDLNVSVLVNNVGIGGTGPLLNHKVEKFYDLMAVNTVPQAILSHEFIPRMLNREKKSAIINLSSIAATKPFGLYPVYSSTKVFNDYLSRASAHEHIDKIDTLSVRPYYVSTPSTGHKSLQYDTISAESCISGALNALGYDRWTNAHWKHKIASHFLELVDDQWLQSYLITKRRKQANKPKYL